MIIFLCHVDSSRVLFTQLSGLLCFGLPMDAILPQQWIQFMFDYVPENDDRNPALCAAHFTEDSFQNLHEINTIQQETVNVLKHEAVPTLKPEAAVDGPQSVSRLRLHHLKCI